MPLSITWGTHYAALRVAGGHYFITNVLEFAQDINHRVCRVKGEASGGRGEGNLAWASCQHLLIASLNVCLISFELAG